MFTASISVATAIGRQTNCGKQKRKSGKSLGETCDFSWVQTSDLCDNYVHGIWADICRHRCQPIECRWLRSYREMKGSGPQLRKGGTPSKRTSEDASRGNIVLILPVYDLQNASCNYRKWISEWNRRRLKEWKVLGKVLIRVCTNQLLRQSKDLFGLFIRTFLLQTLPLQISCFPLLKEVGVSSTTTMQEDASLRSAHKYSCFWLTPLSNVQPLDDKHKTWVFTRRFSGVQSWQSLQVSSRARVSTTT